MTLTKREKLLLGVLLAMLVLWLEYTYVLKAQLQTLDAARNELKTYELKLERLNNAPETNKKLDADIAKGMKQISEVLDTYFTTTEQEEVILLLNDLMAGGGVNTTAILFSEPVDVTIKEIAFRKATVTVNCNATYDALYGFIKKTWNFQKNVVVDQMNMALNNGGTLEGTVVLDLYYLTGLEATQYKDNLYQMIIDESFFKGNPFNVSEGAADFRMNYVFIGGKEPGTSAYTPFVDIAGHWAEKEINAFGEKGYVIKGQDNNFGPDTPMTRGEFVIMLDKIYQWPVPEQPVDLKKYSDYSNLGSYENAMSKAVLKGLLGGYVVGFTDQTLRPRDPITYEEIEFIMQKIKTDPAFQWKTVATKLQQEKGVASAGLTSKKSQVTKAETVYMMTHFK